MSRDIVDRCLGTSLTGVSGHRCILILVWLGAGIPAGDGVAVLAGVTAWALRVVFGQSCRRLGVAGCAAIGIRGEVWLATFCVGRVEGRGAGSRGWGRG